MDHAGAGTAVRWVLLASASAVITAAASSGLTVFMSGFVKEALPSVWVALIVLVPVALVVLATRLEGRLTVPSRRALAAGYTIGVISYLVVLLNPEHGGPRDALTFFGTRLDTLYDLAYADGGVLYPPPFFQLVEAIRGVGAPGLLFLFSAAELAALSVLAGPIAASTLLIPFVAMDVWYANINLLIAVAITLGFRWPALWAFVLLTKITPGIGLVWFAVRREWRRLFVALGATVVIIGISWVISPGLWADWMRAALASAPPGQATDVVPLPLRVACAALVVGAGAAHSKPWTVPVGAAIAMPVLWPAALSVLVAIIPLSRRPSTDGMRRAVDWAIRSRNRSAPAPLADSLVTESRAAVSEPTEQEAPTRAGAIGAANPPRLR